MPIEAEWYRKTNYELLLLVYIRGFERPIDDYAESISKASSKLQSSRAHQLLVKKQREKLSSLETD